MNDWSRRRKRIIILIVLGFFAFLLLIPLIWLFSYHKPTCSDGRQNGDESGIDCGGGCSLLCSPESLPLIRRGDPRIIKVASSTYEVVVIFDNPNSNAVISGANYTLTLFEASTTIPLKVITDKTFVPAGELFAVFIAPFEMPAGVVPVRATFDFDPQTLIWQKVSGLAPELVITDKKFTSSSSTPRLDAVVENRSLDRVSNIELIALLKDASGNIFAASKTFIDTMKSGDKVAVNFTWPKSLGNEPLDTSIIIRVMPDRSFIK